VICLFCNTRMNCNNFPASLHYDDQFGRRRVASPHQARISGDKAARQLTLTHQSGDLHAGSKTLSSMYIELAEARNFNFRISQHQLQMSMYFPELSIHNRTTCPETTKNCSCASRKNIEASSLTVHFAPPASLLHVK
jgi:hypothetical protein